MNRENMTKLALLLEDLPSERFNIEYWFSSVENQMENHELNLNDCGTAGCIAGWALCLKNDGHVEVVDDYYEEIDDTDVNAVRLEHVRDEAADWLGITAFKADRLFYPDGFSVWNKYKDDYGLETFGESTWVKNIHPKHAADMLYRILDGEVEL